MAEKSVSTDSEKSKWSIQGVCQFNDAQGIPYNKEDVFSFFGATIPEGQSYLSSNPPKRVRSASSTSVSPSSPPAQKPRLESTTSSPKTVEGSEYEQHVGKWGFVVYRTFYGDEGEWKRAKKRIVELAVEQWVNKEGEGRGDFTMAKLKFVEDRDVLEGKDVMGVRMIHNPLYQPEKDEDDEDDEDDEEAQNNISLDQYGTLDSVVCVMVDEASMESILNHKDLEEPGYVIAIDSSTRKSEMDAEWDGSMRIAVEALLDDFYLCCIGDGALVMGEMHNPDDPDEVWIGH